MDKSRTPRGLTLSLTLALLAGSFGFAVHTASAAGTGKLPVERLGKRLFRETRFGHFFMSHSNGDVNTVLSSGEPLVDAEANYTGDPATLPDPMQGQAINCMQCHLGRQDAMVAGGGNRAFTDFAVHSPIPPRADDPGHNYSTARNATSIVGARVHGDADHMLHWDGQFGSMTELVAGTLSGRNFGWLATEQAQALHQVAEVIRGDDGHNSLARTFSGGWRYRALFQCNPRVQAEYRLPARFCMDLKTATDAEIVDAVAGVMSAYLQRVDFARDSMGRHTGSPYDQFLIANRLPRSPKAGETPLEYGARLLRRVEALSNPKFVSDGHFKYHGQRPFAFGSHELHGLVMFLRRPAGPVITPEEVAQSGIGNCVACHAPPEFTDSMMHNTGATQFEYDDIHGEGSFANLTIPDLAQREADPDAYLPVTAAHPNAAEPFRRPADASAPGQADLGVWNIFANPDFANRQASLREFLCAIDTRRFEDCGSTDAELLDRAIGVFRTHTVRDMGDSGPYMHSGHFKTLDDVAMFYHHAGEHARDGLLRNADPEIQNIALEHPDLPDLEAFMASLDEDFQE